MTSTSLGQNSKKKIYDSSPGLSFGKSLRKFTEIELHYLKSGKGAGKSQWTIGKLIKGLNGFPFSDELKFSK